eukprot:gene424-694_t
MSSIIKVIALATGAAQVDGIKIKGDTPGYSVLMLVYFVSCPRPQQMAIAQAASQQMAIALAATVEGRDI